MSFLNVFAASRTRAEELHYAWQSLSYDMLVHSSPISPPPTPESSRGSPLTNRQAPSPGLGSVLTTNSEYRSGNTLELKEALSYTSPIPLCPPTLPIPFHSPRNLDIPLPVPALQRSSCLHKGDLLRNNTDLRKRKLFNDAESGAKKRHMTPEEVACQVHGILSLPGCREPRYDVSANELKRRVNRPECLTKVDMISYVRLAKNSARSLLEQHNIKTNQHSQRSEHTVLSKMCEAECTTLASGIRDINFRYFPVTWFANKSVQEITNKNPLHFQQSEALMERLKEVEITRGVLLDIYLGLEKHKTDSEMDVFNLISHSFGLPNLQNHILFLLSYVDEELRILKNV